MVFSGFNYTAIFKPVTIEGSSVSRATVHNVSIMEEEKHLEI